MQAPVPLSALAAAARKAVAGLRAKVTVRPEVAPERQRAEVGGQEREEPGAPPAVSQSGHVTNQMSGTAHKVLQAGDIQGGVRF
jgi:hypothetical protein